MDIKLKFFDQTFRVLLALTVCAWALFAMFLLFADSDKVCVVGAPEPILRTLSLIAGIFTAPPLIYGLARLLFWPGGPKSKVLSIAGLIVGGGIGIFVIGATLFAVSVSQYGCR